MFRNEEYFTLWGDPGMYSPGTGMVMADRQIRRALENNSIKLDEIGNAKAIVTRAIDGKWFMISGGWGNDEVPTAMMGAICGDVAGSVYEHRNIKYKPEPNRLIRHSARITDDSVMTCAVADGLRRGLSMLPKEWLHAPQAEAVLFASVRDALRFFGRKYPHAGYGGRFRQWLAEDDPRPYNSWGNGSAMRASYAGWVAASLEEAEKLAEISAMVTHDHPEGIKGAKAVAGSIFLLRDRGSPSDVKSYAGRFYDLSFTLDEIRDSYAFDVSCMGSVPQAIKAFLEGFGFSDVIANAISIGGDSDTIAAIAGSIAEVIFPIPQGVRGRVIDRMDPFLQDTVAEAVDFMFRRLPADN